MKRWAGAVGMAAALTAGTLAFTVEPAAASPLTIVEDGCWNSGGIWGDRSQDLTVPYFYVCTYFHTNGTYTQFFFNADGSYYDFTGGGNGGSPGNYHQP